MVIMVVPFLINILALRWHQMGDCAMRSRIKKIPARIPKTGFV
jgi:hypothetical protein